MIRTKMIDRNIITPFRPENVQPNSYDLTLGGDFLIPKKYRLPKTLLEDELKYDEAKDEVVLHKGDFILGTTAERVKVPIGLCAFVEGRSSVGRWGLEVHVSAGFVDSGFEGNITLEIVNNAPYMIRLKKGMRICQVIFMDSEKTFLYNGHYQHQTGTTAPVVQYE